jgi:hypothetical protein
MARLVMGSGDYRLPRQRERLVVADAGDGRRPRRLSLP